MKMMHLNVRVTSDTLADIDEFAQRNFVKTCPKCRGEGLLRSTGEPCPTCGGSGQTGSQADAIRYLLHFAIAEQFSPEARAMAAVYENTAPLIAQECKKVLHYTTETLKTTIQNVIMSGNIPPPPPAPTKRKRRKRGSALIRKPGGTGIRRRGGEGDGVR